MLGLGVALVPSAARQPGGGPSLDLDFLSGTLDSRVSFSRASMAWQTNVTGTLTTAPHNLLTHSDFFANSAWVKTSCTVTANNAVAPDGTMTADTITFSSGTGLMRQTISGLISGATYTFSMHVRLVSGSTGINVDVGDGPGVSVTTLSSNWSRITITTTAGAGGWLDFRSNAAAVWEIWGAQLEQHGSARPYLSTGVKNLLGFTEAFDNAAWAKTASTITANAATAPDGALAADKLVESATNAEHYIEQTHAGGVGIAVTYTLSVHVKAAERSVIQLRPVHSSDGAGTSQINFDLTTKTWTLVNQQRITSYGYTEAGNGWFRVWCVFSPTVAVTSVRARFHPMAGGSHIYQGDGTSGILIWGAQLSASGSLDAYSPNLGAAPASAAYHGPRFDHDPITKVARGLLIEEARTNLAPGILTGGTYWASVGTGASTASGAAAPDGTSNGVTVTEGGTVTSYGLNQASTVTITASSPVTGSIFVKAGTSNWYRMLLINNLTPTVAVQAWFDVTAGTVGTVGIFSQTGGTPTGFSASIQNAGGGWWRCSLTATLATVTTAAIMARIVSGDAVTSDVGGKTMSFFGPQLEQGAFATSYIPTTTASASRAADVANITSLSGWYNQAEGTLFVEVETPSQAANPVTAVSFGLSTGAFADSIYLSHTNNGDYMGVTSGGGTVATVGYGTILGGVRKVAGAYKLNDFTISRAGAAVATDTSGAVPAVATAASIGKAPWGNSNYLCGYIRRVRCWPTRRPNGELQSMTVI